MLSWGWLWGGWSCWQSDRGDLRDRGRSWEARDLRWLWWAGLRLLLWLTLWLLRLANVEIESTSW